jgi:hypothetical protein
MQSSHCPQQLRAQKTSHTTAVHNVMDMKFANNKQTNKQTQNKNSCRLQMEWKLVSQYVYSGPLHQVQIWRSKLSFGSWSYNGFAVHSTSWQFKVTDTCVSTDKLTYSSETVVTANTHDRSG